MKRTSKSAKTAKNVEITFPRRKSVKLMSKKSIQNKDRSITGILLREVLFTHKQIDVLFISLMFEERDLDIVTR